MQPKTNLKKLYDRLMKNNMKYIKNEEFFRQLL